MRQIIFNLRNRLLGINYLDHLIEKKLIDLKTSLLEQSGQGRIQSNPPLNIRYCPICQNTCTEFSSFKGMKILPGIKCPHCNSLDRHRLVWLFFINKTPLFFKKIKMLHFAPEPSIKQKLKKLPNLDYLTTDLSGANVDHVWDIQDIDCDDEGFDAIYCSHVLEHVPDDHKAMRELHRILRPGGWIVIMVPINFNLKKTHEDPSITTPEDRIKHYGQANHLRYYGLDFSQRLEKAGFSNVQAHEYTKQFDEFQKRLYGLPKRYLIFFGKK